MRRLLKKKFSLILMALFLSLFLLSLNYIGVKAKENKDLIMLAKATSSSKKVGREFIGKMAPDFTLNSIYGENYQLSNNTRGKVVLLDFWHTY
jgi:cytochrome oxidase Cu insertion factor (SCO1/SenC/PrrC family)